MARSLRDRVRLNLLGVFGMAQDKTFFSAKSLAIRWDVARSTVYRFVERGQLAPPLKINCNSRWRIEDVLAFEEAMRGKS